jgi:hypothetical protein
MKAVLNGTFGSSRSLGGFPISYGIFEQFAVVGQRLNDMKEKTAQRKLKPNGHRFPKRQSTSSLQKDFMINNRLGTH